MGLGQALLLSTVLGNAQAERLSYGEILDKYPERTNAVLDPQIGPEACTVDAREYPMLRFEWGEFEGPGRFAEEVDLILGQSEGLEDDATQLEYEMRDHGFKLESDRFAENVEVVVAVDVSASMLDDLQYTEAIVEFVESYNPDANIQVSVVEFDIDGVKVIKYSNGRVRQRRQVYDDFVYYEPIYSSNSVFDYDAADEDYPAAFDVSLDILGGSENDPKRKKYVVLITDEPDHRFSDEEVDVLIERINEGGVKVFMLFAGGYYDAEASYPKLSRIAVETGGGYLGIDSGEVPDIFVTERYVENIRWVFWDDQEPYFPGERRVYIANGEGAICDYAITQQDIDDAIDNCRLESLKEPEEELEDLDKVEVLPTSSIPSILDWYKKNSKKRPFLCTGLMSLVAGAASIMFVRSFVRNYKK